jgi:L-ascorbate metabolism protein UlaG (beta-lactamase superfamily)
VRSSRRSAARAASTVIDHQAQAGLSRVRTHGSALHGSITFVGTATLLIRCGGFTILTGPNLVHRHEQVSIRYGTHATRLTDPAIEIGALPELHLVVLSHLHGDHFDKVAERELERSLPIITTSEAAGELRQLGFSRTHPLETRKTFETVKAGVSLRVTAAPGRHGPPLVDLALPEVIGSIFEFGWVHGGVPRRL